MQLKTTVVLFFRIVSVLRQTTQKPNLMRQESTRRSQTVIQFANILEKGRGAEVWRTT